MNISIDPASLETEQPKVATAKAGPALTRETKAAKEKRIAAAFAEAKAHNHARGQQVRGAKLAMGVLVDGYRDFHHSVPGRIARGSVYAMYWGLAALLAYLAFA